MLSGNNIHYRFGSHEVLKGVSFSIGQGELVGLIGPSGGGKSTLLKIISGIREPQIGEIKRKCESVTLLFQEGALFDSLNVFDNVAFPLVHGHVPASLIPFKDRVVVRDKVAAILSRVGLDWAYHKMPGELSGGMRRRVSLARALVTNPRAVLLDDPTSGLDPVASSVIMNLIVEIHRETKSTMLIVSHDLRRLLPVIGRMYALFDGKIQYNGTVASLEKADCNEVKHFISCRYDFRANKAA